MIKRLLKGYLVFASFVLTVGCIFLLVVTIKFYSKDYMLNKFCEDCQHGKSELEIDEQGYRIVRFSYGGQEYIVKSLFSFEELQTSDTKEVTYYFDSSDPNSNYLDLEEDRYSAQLSFKALCVLLLINGLIIYYLIRKKR